MDTLAASTVQGIVQDMIGRGAIGSQTAEIAEGIHANSSKDAGRTRTSVDSLVSAINTKPVKESRITFWYSSAQQRRGCTVGTAISLPGAIQENPFRVLDLPSHASSREIQQQGDHFLVLSEMQAGPSDYLLPWLPPPNRSPQSIQRAIHELNDGVRRIYAEAMWLPPPQDAAAKRAYSALRNGKRDDKGASMPPQASAILTLAQLLVSPQSAEAWTAAAEDCATWWLSSTWDDLTSKLRNNHDPRLRSLDAEHIRNATIAAVAEYWRQTIIAAINEENYRKAVGVLRATQTIHHIWPEAAADLRRELIDALSKALNVLMEPVHSAEEGTDLTPLLQQSTTKLRGAKTGILAIESAFDRANPDWLALNDTLGETHRQLAVLWNNRVGDTEQAQAILKEVETIPASEQIKARLTRDLHVVAKNVTHGDQTNALFAGFTTIDKAPKLYRINGIGQTMIGEGSLGEGMSLSTLFFTILWIPVFALKRYVISREGETYRFYMKGPLTSKQRWWNGAAATILTALLFFGSMDGAGPVVDVSPPSGGLEDRIVVGRGIGGIELGWTVDAAVSSVGRNYDHSWDTKDGGRGYYWELDGNQFANPDPDLEPRLVAFTDSEGRIEEIQTTAAWFKTRSGIEVGHPRSLILERLRPDATFRWEDLPAEGSRAGLGWAYKTLDGVETIVMFVVFRPRR